MNGFETKKTWSKLHGHVWDPNTILSSIFSYITNSDAHIEKKKYCNPTP